MANYINGRGIFGTLLQMEGKIGPFSILKGNFGPFH